MNTKTQVAFIMTAQRMFASFPKVYFWTFTFRHVYTDERAMYYWANFIRDVNNRLGGSVQGVRVVEVHPGGHGLHFHALLNRRVPISLLKKIGWQWGFGHMWVEQCDKMTSFYLAKYLSKEHELAKGCRRWGTIGGYRQVRVNDLQVESVLMDNIRHFQEGDKTKTGLAYLKQRVTQLDYSTFKSIALTTRLYGRVQDWPRHEYKVCPSQDKRHFGKLNRIDIVWGENPRPTPFPKIMEKSDMRKTAQEIMEDWRTEQDKTWRGEEQIMLHPVTKEKLELQEKNTNEWRQWHIQHTDITGWQGRREA